MVDPHRVYISGPTRWKPADITAPAALRPSVVILLAMLAAPGKSVLRDVYNINWWHDADDLTDRSEKFLAGEIVREKLFRLTGDELPYTSTVVVEKFDEEKSRQYGRLVRIAATIVVERDSHKAMIIGESGQRLKRIGTEARLELEKLLGCKVFIELWIKVRSGWADDEARVRSFGYE